MKGLVVNAAVRISQFVVLLSGLLGAEVTRAATCVTLPTNLVSWWQAEGDLTDSWGTNNGAAFRGPAYATGKIGLALSNSIVVVPDSPSLHFSNAFTVLAWINVSASSNANPCTIVSKYEYPLDSLTATQSSFFFGLTTTNQLLFLAASNGVPGRSLSLNVYPPLIPGQWYHVGATYDHTHIRLYLNGQLAISRDYFNGLFPGSAPLAIGGMPDPALPQGRLSLPGLIDEVSVFNRALSSTEIYTIWSADGAGFCPVAPLIDGPADRAVPLNETAVFSISVQGTRPLTYQWRFNGTNIARATNSTLYLEHAGTNQVGHYSVVVSNQAGAVASRAAALTLLPPLPCVAPPPGIISWWPADGSVVDVVGTNNGSDIFPVFGDLYTTGKVGAALAAAVRVPNSPSLNFGSNANFSFEAWVKAMPTISPALFKDTNTVTIADKFALNVGYSFFLFEGHPAFQVGGTPLNPAGTVTYVASGPDLRDGHFHHLACTIDRTSANNAHLYVDGLNALTFDLSSFRGSLSNAAPLTLGDGAAVLQAPTREVIDEITLYNRPLTASEVASIFLAGSAGKCKSLPVIVQQPQSQTVVETSNATFTVTATGPGLKYQWRFFGNNLAGATGSSITITNVTKANEGLYSVRVSNAFGAVTSSIATLLVHMLPIAQCKNVQVSADDTCSAMASVDAGSFSPKDGAVTVAQSPPGPYPLGTNLVTLSVTDTLGITVFCNALVVVFDNTPPMIHCPPNITVEFATEIGTAVSFDAQANDNCSGAMPVISVPASGAMFPIGTTTVTNTATDGAGNGASCFFQITVLGSQGVISNSLSDLLSLKSIVTRRSDLEALDSAIVHLSDSLSSSFWMNQTHLNGDIGMQVFNNDKIAVQALFRLLNQKQSTVDAAQIQPVIDRIVKSDRLLATIAMNDALAAGVAPTDLNQASDQISRGTQKVADGQYEAGIALYRNAWNQIIQQAH
jgi:Concanavalin A-like lectin/glucanases superfamily/HYR domain/Immunoglobulin domain